MSRMILKGIKEFQLDESGNLVIGKAAGIGVKVDASTPSFGWRDLLGSIHARPAGGGGSSAIPDFSDIS